MPIIKQGQYKNGQPILINYANDEYYIRLHERDILELVMRNKALQKQIDKNNAEIERLKNLNREIKGRPIKA